MNRGRYVEYFVEYADYIVKTINKFGDSLSEKKKKFRKKM